jgi:acetyltransferase-like isoleucine patch superfamily enzyme
MRMRNRFFSLRSFVYECLNLLVTYAPGRWGNTLRYRYYKRKLKYLGKGAIIDFGVYIINPHLISIGDKTHIDRWVTLAAGKAGEGKRNIYRKNNTKFNYEPGEIFIGQEIHIAPYVYIVGAGGVEIQDRSGIAAGTKIFSISHHFRNLNDPEDKKMYVFGNRVCEEDQALIIGPVVMEKNTAIGLNSVLLPGATVGQNSWVGVLSCVSKDIPANVIATGNPAQAVKSRGENS